MGSSQKIGRTLQRDSAVPWYALLLLAFAFGISYGQFPLYYFTQNGYFFHGLARAGFGLLRSDWVAGTADPWPVFTMLVEFTYRYLDQRVFYFYFVVLLGIYAYSALGIASALVQIDGSRPKYLAYLAVVAALHSPVFGYLSIWVFGFDVGRALVEGVASQRMLWDMLQPGAFGVFLLLSIHLFLRGKLLLAIVASSLAAMFHPSYVLAAGALTASYMIIMVRRGERPVAILKLALYSLGLILPMLVYAYLAFRPTSPDLWAEAQAILVQFRNRRHAVPAAWVGGTVYLKVAVTLVAMYLARRTELFWIMLVSFVTAVGLTVVQVLSGSNTLALLYPWRISVLLVPLSTIVVLAYGVAAVFDVIERFVARRPSLVITVSLIVVIGLAAAGAVETGRRFRSGIGTGADEATEFVGVKRTYVIGVKSSGVMNFVRATRSPGHTYLIPLDWRYFRLFTGAPAFVDYWFIPYDDVAVMEWRKRVRLANAFYDADGEPRCQVLKRLLAGYGITEVIVKAGGSEYCSGWKPLFGDENYRLYTIIP